MTFKEYKEIIKKDPSFKEKIYYSNFFTFNPRKYNYPEVTVCKNILFKYVVATWLDYECFRQDIVKVFKNKDEAIDFAWNLLKKKKFVDDKF